MRENAKSVNANSKGFGTGHIGTRTIAVLMAFIWSLFVVSGVSEASVFYFDSEGRLTGSPPPGTDRLQPPSPWWLDKRAKVVEGNDSTGGTVSMPTGREWSQEPFSRAITGIGCTILIVNADDPGEGLNDTTPTLPVGGNNGTTLGAQRVNLLERVAQIWSSEVFSEVPIIMGIVFDPLPCTETGAVGGLASPASLHKDFLGALRPSTWYVQAQANALAGTDLSPSMPDAWIAFNSSLDEECVPGISWYYGLDGNCPPNQLDLLTLALHEVCHGLGFLTLVGQNGAKYNGYDDIFMVFLRDVSTGKNWPEMTNSQRISSSIDTGDLVWTGDSVNAAASTLTSGHHAVTTDVMMYAPNPYEPASSVSHFTTECEPNELMEPSYTETIHNTYFSRQLLVDLGWPTPVEQNTPTPASCVEHWEMFD